MWYCIAYILVITIMLLWLHYIEEKEKHANYTYSACGMGCCYVCDTINTIKLTDKEPLYVRIPNYTQDIRSGNTLPSGAIQEREVRRIRSEQADIGSVVSK